MVKIELGKRSFIWIGLLLVLVGVGFTFAYGGNNPGIMGHSQGELEGMATITYVDSQVTNLDSEVTNLQTQVTNLDSEVTNLQKADCPTQIVSWGGCSDQIPAGRDVSQRPVNDPAPEFGHGYYGSAIFECNDGTWQLIPGTNSCNYE